MTAYCKRWVGLLSPDEPKKAINDLHKKMAKQTGIADLYGINKYTVCAVTHCFKRRGSLETSLKVVAAYKGGAFACSRSQKEPCYAAVRNFKQF